MDVDRRDKVITSPKLLLDKTTRLVGHLLGNPYRTLADQSQNRPFAMIRAVETFWEFFRIYKTL
jgi:hypothetical protein